MMTTTERLDAVHRRLKDRQIDEAERALLDIVPDHTSERRRQAHLGAIVQFYRGDIGRARALLERASEDFGENVNLLRDLMICQYHLQDMTAFRLSLTRLELRLIEQEAALSAASIVESEVWLGKFMEEEARLAAAQVFYERALSRETDPHGRLLALIQKARWQALYEPGPELGALYRELISQPLDDVSRHLRSELEHTLMLIELRLVGVDHAWNRIERARAELIEMDQRLLVFDFVEGALSQDLKLNDEVIAKVNAFETLDPYESYLKSLVNGGFDHARKLSELTLIATKLTWSSYLRLLCLTANLESTCAPRQELNRKIQLIISGLDTRSQRIWRRRLKQAMATPEVRVELSLRARTVAIHGKTLDLNKKKIGLQLLAGLSRKPSLSVDEAINLLWQSSFSPEHYHRLRMSTHRLNTLLHDGTGVGKLIEVDSQSVRLRPEVRLRNTDGLGEGKLLN